MKLSDETKELITTTLIVIACIIVIGIILGLVVGYYYFLSEFIIKCLNIIFNHK